jgi:dihydrofolate reductase
MKELALIAARGRNDELGLGDGLPWRLPPDLRHFKRHTLGKVVIMGRKTWDTVKRPLPGRTTIVVTRDEGFAAPGAEVVHSLEAALDRAGERDVMIAGGAEIYRQAFALVDRMYLTTIDADFDADTWFPRFDEEQFRLVSVERHEPDAEAAWPYQFELWERVSGR